MILLSPQSYIKYKINQVLREELAPKSIVIGNMGVRKSFTRGKPSADFSRSSDEDLSKGKSKVVKFCFYFSKLRKRRFLLTV